MRVRSGGPEGAAAAEGSFFLFQFFLGTPWSSQQGRKAGCGGKEKKKQGAAFFWRASVVLVCGVRAEVVGSATVSQRCCPEFERRILFPPFLTLFL